MPDAKYAIATRRALHSRFYPAIRSLGVLHINPTTIHNPHSTLHSPHFSTFFSYIFSKSKGVSSSPLWLHFQSQDLGAICGKASHGPCAAPLTAFLNSLFNSPVEHPSLILHPSTPSSPPLQHHLNSSYLARSQRAPPPPLHRAKAPRLPPPTNFTPTNSLIPQLHHRSLLLAMLIDGEKYACEACVRGHRVSTCQHSGKLSSSPSLCEGLVMGAC